MCDAASARYARGLEACETCVCADAAEGCATIGAAISPEDCAGEGWGACAMGAGGCEEHAASNAAMAAAGLAMRRMERNFIDVSSCGIARWCCARKGLKGILISLAMGVTF